MARLISGCLLVLLMSCAGKVSEQKVRAPKETANAMHESDSLATIKAYPESVLRKTSHPRRKNTRQSPARYLNNSISLRQQIKNLDQKLPIEFDVDTGHDTTLSLPEGTVIRIPKDAFALEHLTGTGPERVIISVTEYYTLADMMLGNLTTSTKDEMLETAGMINIDAKANGKNAVIAKGKALEIHFRSESKKEGMQLFTGKRDDDDVVIWEPLVVEPEAPAYLSIVETMPEYPGGVEKLFEYIKKNARYPSDMRRTSVGGTVYVQLTIDEKGAVGEKQVLRGVHKSLDNAALAAFDNMPAWKPGRENGKNVKVKIVLPVRFMLGDSAPNALTPAGDLEIFTTDSSGAASNVRSASNYVLSTTKLGWINCDRFLNIKPLRTLRIYTGETADTDIKIIFKKYKSIIPGYAFNGYHYFYNVPLGEPISVFALRKKNNMLTFATKQTTTDLENAELDFKPVTLALLKSEIEALAKQVTNNN